MAVLKLVTIPDKRLRQITHVIEMFDTHLQKIIDDMIETMYAANGVGLASTQVGLDIRLCVMDCSKERDQPIVVINPEIIEARDYIPMQEGCLSVPGHYDTVTRANWVKMKAVDRHKKPFTLEAEGLLAECIQHEIDHLHGKLYIDQLSKFKQTRILSKVLKQSHQAKKLESNS